VDSQEKAQGQQFAHRQDLEDFHVQTRLLERESPGFLFHEQEDAKAKADKAKPKYEKAAAAEKASFAKAEAAEKAAATAQFKDEKLNQRPRPPSMTGATPKTAPARPRKRPRPRATTRFPTSSASFVVFGVIFGIGWAVMGKSFGKFFKGFIFVFIVACIAYFASPKP
jgi:uncharacterized membrane protein